MSTLILKKTEKSQLKPLIMPVLQNLMVIDNQQLFIKKKVRELLFDGYRISFLHNLKEQLKTFGISLQLQDTFGFFLNVSDQIKTSSANKTTIYLFQLFLTSNHSLQMI